MITKMVNMSVDIMDNVLSLMETYFALQEKRTLVRGEKCHHKLIDDSQKRLCHQKLNVTKSGVAESISVVVTFKVRQQ